MNEEDTTPTGFNFNPDKRTSRSGFVSFYGLFLSPFRRIYEWHDRVVALRRKATGSDTLVNFELGRRLMQEEFTEFFTEVESYNKAKSFREAFEARARACLEAADILYVLFQNLHMLGVPLITLEEAIHAVSQANESKLEAPVFDEGGKLKKGPNYTKLPLQQFSLYELENWRLLLDLENFDFDKQAFYSAFTHRNDKPDF